jgi:hypothetical protein
MALGLAITMAGPRVLSWLGLDAWLVRKTGFEADEIIHVSQDIDDTLTEYETIVGAIDLAQRSDEQLRAVGATDPAALREQAAEARTRHTEKAHRLELELIGLFREAYDKAGTSYAGLRNLDAAAARFARLRHVALPADARRQALQESFAAMDPANAELKNATVQDIRDMKQWTKLNSELNELDNALRESPIKWDPVYEHLNKCKQVMDNAHYRVDSAAAGYRPDPMLPKGTPAYDEYVDMLSARELRYGRLLARAAELSGGGEIFYVPTTSVWDHRGGDPLAAVTLLQSLRSAYDQQVNDAAAAMPELATAAAWADSNVLMHRLEKAHRDHPGLFDRLRITELALQASIGQAHTALVTAKDSSPTMPELVARETAAAELAIRARRVVRGLVLPDELDAELTERRAIEDRTLAARLDAAHPRPGVAPSTKPGVAPLSEVEITALHSKELSGQGAKMTSTEHQLAKAWELTSQWRSLPLASNDPQDLFHGNRWERDLLKIPGPKFWKYEPGFFDSADHLDVPAGRAIIVARVGADISGRTSIFSGPARYAHVLAITAAAVELLGAEPVYVRLHHDELAPLAPGELDLRDPAAPPLTPSPVPATAAP